MGEEDERFSAGADSAGRGADRVRAACVDPVARRTQGREGHDRRVADAGGVCKKSGDLVRERQAVKFAAIADWADSNSYPVAFMCVELGVSRSGYYAWRTAAPSQRSKDDTTLIALMKKLHAEARGNPGVRRLHAGLAALGHRLIPTDSRAFPRLRMASAQASDLHEAPDTLARQPVPQGGQAGVEATDARIPSGLRMELLHDRNKGGVVLRTLGRSGRPPRVVARARHPQLDAHESHRIGIGVRPCRPGR